MKKLQDDDGGDEYLQYKAVGQVAEMSSLSIGMDRCHTPYCTSQCEPVFGEEDVVRCPLCPPT